MDDVIVDAVGGDDHVADVLGVQWHVEIQRVLDRPHRDHSVNRGANPANPLREQPGVAGIAILEDDLNAAPHLPRRPGVDDFAVIHLAIDP